VVSHFSSNPYCQNVDDIDSGDYIASKSDNVEIADQLLGIKPIFFQMLFHIFVSIEKKKKMY
jgi:hypothetical protein